MLEELKHIVFAANQELPRQGLITLTWGNVSGIDRQKGLIVIKPSGVSYDKMTWEQMVVVDMDGNVVEGELNPSSDTPTHCILYRHFEEIGGIVHTHSPHATAFAQAGCAIKSYGTTHADYFYGDIPLTRELTDSEIAGDYETETGKVIIETLAGEGIDVLAVPGILVKTHGPFTWGTDPLKAVENAVVLEEVAKMAYYTRMLDSATCEIKQTLLDKHYLRKHGKNAYYGQKNNTRA